MERDVVIFDLDGTIADATHRQHFVHGKEAPDWHSFHKACVDDTPVDAVIQMVKALTLGGFEVWIFSGRSKVVLEETLAWLIRNHNIMAMLNYSGGRLVMREEHDFTPDEQLKRQWIDEYGLRDRVLCVYEDRTRVVNMWRREGIRCFQVAPGDF